MDGGLVATYGIGRLAYGLFVPTFREEFGLSLDVLGFYASTAQAGYVVATAVTVFSRPVSGLACRSCPGVCCWRSARS